MAVTIKSPREIACMREAGRLLAEVHEELGRMIRPGISTKEIDRECERLIRERGCVPNFLHYQGYPASVCVSVKAQKLMDVTKQSFFEGIRMARAGNRLFDISNAIDAYVTPFGYGIVRALVGHGIGTRMHEDPQIPNFAQRRRGMKLRTGMTLAVEPMINMGTAEVEWLDDDWTVISRDHSLSAHYENTILITDGEPEILTLG